MFGVLTCTCLLQCGSLSLASRLYSILFLHMKVSKHNFLRSARGRATLLSSEKIAFCNCSFSTNSSDARKWISFKAVLSSSTCSFSSILERASSVGDFKDTITWDTWRCKSWRDWSACKDMFDSASTRGCISFRFFPSFITTDLGIAL